MNVMLDTCVIIDFLQGRDPFDADANVLMESCARGKIAGCISAKAVTDIYYIMHRYLHDDEKARKLINKLLEIVSVADTSADDVFRALYSDVKDFEDAVLAETALKNNMDCIITRNLNDFDSAGIKVYSPEKFISEYINL